jgi:WD40 repeat protein
METPTKHNATVTMPYREIGVSVNIRRVLLIHLLDEKRIIIYSLNGSFRVWDLETGTQVGEEWEDEDREVETIVLSPDGKEIASAGNRDGAVKLWNVDTGKAIKTLTVHTGRVEKLSLDQSIVSWRNGNTTRKST